MFVHEGKAYEPSGNERNWRNVAIEIAKERGCRIEVKVIPGRYDDSLKEAEIHVFPPAGKMLRKVGKYGIIERTGEVAVCREWEHAVDILNSVQIVDSAGDA